MNLPYQLLRRGCRGRADGPEPVLVRNAAGAPRRCGGLTLPEVLIAVVISGLVGATLLTCVLSAAREARRNLADTLLQQQAGQVEDRLLRLIRSMSAKEGVAFGSPVSAGVYQRIVVARGPVPDYPRQEIYFNTNSCSLNVDTNRSVVGSDLPLVTSRPDAVLNSVYFYPSMKADGSMDGSIVNVYIELQDRASSGRKNSDGTLKTNIIRRLFAVSIRNP